MKPMPEQTSQVVGKAKKSEILHARVKKKGPIAKSTAPSLELYQMESCPFSHAVRNRLTALGLDYIAHNVSAGNDLKHQQLVRAGGKDQIPFLIDHKTGVKLYESDAILAYLDKEYGAPSPSFVTTLARDIERRIRSNADKLSWGVKVPLERASSLRHDLRDGWQTVLGGARVVRESIGAAIRSARKRAEAVSTTAATEQDEDKAA